MVKLTRRMGVVSLIFCFVILMVSYHARGEMERNELTMGKNTLDRTINSYWKTVRTSMVGTLSQQQLKREDQDDTVAPSANNRTLPSSVLVYNR